MRPLARWRSLAVPRSLGAKLVIVLTAIGAIGAVAIMGVLAAIITPSFARLEQAAVDSHIQQTRAMLADFADTVESTVRDYGDWTDSYSYIQSRDPAFERESFSSRAMADLGMNGVAYIADDRQILMAHWTDRGTASESAPMRSRFVSAIGRIDFDRRMGSAKSTSFYLPVGNILSAVGVARIRRSDKTGDPRGFVVMARVLSGDQLSALLRADATIRYAGGRPVPAVTVQPHRLDLAIPFVGVNRTPVAHAIFPFPRDLTVLGRTMLFFAVGGMVALLVLVLVVLKSMVARLVLRPLAGLERHMQSVRESGEMTLLSTNASHDEIGSLVDSLNDMLRRLNDLSEQLESQSFKLGKSESAVAVMHNVRNALSPISIILSQELSQPQAVDVGLVERAVNELARDDLAPERRRKLVELMAAATAAAVRARADRLAQMETGRDALHNALEIIGTQQEVANDRPIVEECDVAAVVERNAAIVRFSGPARIDFSYPERERWVLASRVLLSQVIGNLFANAVEAIAAREAAGRIAVTTTEAAGTVTIVIADDGDGFDSDTGQALFQRGFSTRRYKSGGLGLHWCANAMLSMGGSLHLESDGPGLGARAVLTLRTAPAGCAEPA